MKFNSLRPIHFNSPVTFGGVPHNFNYTNQPQPPMSGGSSTQVPTPSPIVPGTTAAPNTDPMAPQNQNQPQQQSPSPLDKYKEFFNNTPSSTNTPNNQQQPPAQPAPSVLDANAQHYAKVAEKMSFINTITPEQKAAMAAGGEEGVNAMMSVIDSIGRNIYAQAGATASSVTKKGVELTKAEIDAKTNRALTLAQSTSEIASTNAIMQDPIYKPMVSAVQTHFLSMKPELSAKELAELTVGYFDNLAQKTGTNNTNIPPADADPTGMKAFFDSL